MNLAHLLASEALAKNWVVLSGDDNLKETKVVKMDVPKVGLEDREPEGLLLGIDIDGNACY